MAKKILNGLDLVKTQILNALMHIVAGDPSTPSEGQFWWDSSAQRVGVRGTSTTHKLVRDGGDLSAGSVANIALATNPLARANHTGTQASSTISDLATVVKAYRLDEFAVPTADINVNSRKITGLATPVSGTDAANKQYVDDAVAGFSWKESARVRVDTNVTTTSPGASLDGVTMATNDRVLLTGQSTGSQNGLWIWNGAASAMTRPTDFDSDADASGAAIMITEGTSASQQWVLTTDSPITIGTTSLTWVQFGGGASYTAGNGLTLTSTDFNVGAGTGISVGADTVSIDTAVVVRKYAVTVGNGALTSIPITHSLGTKDVTYSVRQVSDDAFVDCDAVATDTNTLTLTFAVAPTTNSLRVTVHG